MKFLVLWNIELSLLSEAMVRAIARMPEYGDRPASSSGKVLTRYHVVGAHGGAWIYEVDSHEEFERLLAMAPVFNFARYDVRPLADMSEPTGPERADRAVRRRVVRRARRHRHLVVSERLRERRRELGLTQKEVVARLRRMGVTTTNKALSSLEHGAGLDVCKLPELARALDCTLTYLVGLTDRPDQLAARREHWPRHRSRSASQRGLNGMPPILGPASPSAAPSATQDHDEVLSDAVPARSTGRAHGLRRCADVYMLRISR